MVSYLVYPNVKWMFQLYFALIIEYKEKEKAKRCIIMYNPAIESTMFLCFIPIVIVDVIRMENRIRKISSFKDSEERKISFIKDNWDLFCFWSCGIYIIFFFFFFLFIFFLKLIFDFLFLYLFFWYFFFLMFFFFYFFPFFFLYLQFRFNCFFFLI